jgi:hypothetical protein
MAEILPFQDGDSLPGDDHGSIEILESSGTIESTTNKVSMHAQEVFMVRGRSPLRAPTPPDINSDDEGPSAISLDALGDPNETEAEKTARKRTSRGRVTASRLNIDVRLRLITKPGWSNMIANA